MVRYFNETFVHVFVLVHIFAAKHRAFSVPLFVK
jgi:hypothetical protein